MRKIHCLNAISKHGTDLLTADYELTDNVKEAEGILVRSASLHEMEFPNSLLAVARAGAGVNNIPLDACAQEGIVVFNTPGANANAVKELVIGALMLASRDILGGINWCIDNAEDANIAKSVEKAKKVFAGCEIRGKKLGVIGLGAIGAEVANACAGLGMEVYGYDPFISVQAAWMLSRDVKHTTSLDTIFQECDYITLHVPALDSTKGMIGKDALSLMKEGVIVLNFARDVLVDSEAMVDALVAGKVKHYVTDFPTPEIAGVKGAIVIPHLGASTEESEDNCAVMAVKELMDFVENGNIKHSVNYPDCSAGTCVDVGRVTINHKNIPNMISQFTKALGDAGVNISNMTNKSKGDFAYTMIDVSTPISSEVTKALKNIQGVYRVRVIK